MRYHILSGKQVIGTSGLEGRDVGMGVAYGPFVPTAGYERVRATFRLFVNAEEHKDHDAIRAYEAARAQLELSLQREDGLSIESDWIHVVDYSQELGEAAYDVTVRLASREGFEKLDPVPSMLS